MKPNPKKASLVGIILLLLLAACGPAAPVVAPADPGDAHVEGAAATAETQASETAGPAEQATPTQLAQPTATEQKVTPTALPTSYPPHPLGCIQAKLSESLLIQTWSERQRQHFITPINSQTGQPLCNLEPLPAGINFVAAYSPDMRQLALVASDKEDGRDSSLQLLDLQRWQVNPTQVKFKNWVVSMRFSPDGKQLAIAAVSPESPPFGIPKGYQIVMVDALTGSARAEMTVDFMPRLIRFSAEGGSLIVYGAPADEQDRVAGDARALLLDTANLDLLWETALEGVIHGMLDLEAEDDPLGQEIWEPAVVYAPEQHALYVVHADADRLTTVDFRGQTTHSAEIGPKASWLERLLALTAGVAHAKTLDGYFKSGVLSPDGKRLFVLAYSADSWQDEDGNWQFSETPLGLKVIDLASGAEVAQIDTSAKQMNLSADGHKLFLRGWDDSDWTEVLNVASLKIERRLAGQSIMPGMRLDGLPQLLSVTYHSNGQTTLATVASPDYQDIFEGWITYNSYWLLER